MKTINAKSCTKTNPLGSQGTNSIDLTKKSKDKTLKKCNIKIFLTNIEQNKYLLSALLSWPYPLIFQNYVDDSFIKVLRIGRI